MLGDAGQVTVFRKILPDETIGIFIQSTFPGGIRMREIDTGIKVACHAFMVGKFPAIVIGDGVYSVDVGAEALYDRMADSLSRLTGDGPDHRIQRLALNQRYHRTPVTLADHGVTLPIAEAALAIDNGRALIR